MKYVGCKRVKGEKEGFGYDFYEIYALEKADEKYAEQGWKPYQYYSKKQKRVKYPAISAAVFNDCLANGLKVNSEVSFYFDNGFRCMRVEAI